MKTRIFITIFGLLLGIGLMISSPTNAGVDKEDLVSCVVSLDQDAPAFDIVSDVPEQLSFDGSVSIDFVVRSFGKYPAPVGYYNSVKLLCVKGLYGNEVPFRAT